MRAAGFVKKHVWVPEEQARRLEEIAAEMREKYRPDRVKTLDEALHRLRASRAEPEDAGVRHVAIFGSFARGDDRPDSDIDLLVSLDPETKLGLFEYAALPISAIGSSAGQSTSRMAARSKRSFSRRLNGTPSMPSKWPELRFRHIVENIDLILEFTRNMNLDEFMSDDRTRLAVERYLLSETARKLGSEAEARRFHGIECGAWETGCGTTTTK